MILLLCIQRQNSLKICIKPSSSLNDLNCLSFWGQKFLLSSMLFIKINTLCLSGHRRMHFIFFFSYFKSILPIVCMKATVKKLTPLKTDGNEWQNHRLFFFFILCSDLFGSNFLWKPLVNSMWSVFIFSPELVLYVFNNSYYCYFIAYLSKTRIFRLGCLHLWSLSHSKKTYPTPQKRTPPRPDFLKALLPTVFNKLLGLFAVLEKHATYV